MPHPRPRRRRGWGTIRTLPDGRFRAQCSFVDTTGKRHFPQATFATEAEADAWLAAQKVLRDTGRAAEGDDPPAAEWLAEWVAAAKPDLAPNTWRQYDQHVRLHLAPRLGKVRLSKLTARHVAGLYAAMESDGVSAAMRHKVATTLRAALKTAERLRLVSRNVAADVPKPKQSRDVEPVGKVWTAEECRRFLASVKGHRREALFALALDSGMRQGELLALCWDRVDTAAGTVRVDRSLENDNGKLRPKATKTASSRRTLRIRPETAALLAELRSRMAEAGRDVTAGPVFIDVRGGYVQAHNFNRDDWRPLRGKAGVPEIRFHDLRHTCATLLLTAGVNIKAVSQRLGHSSVTVTLNTYAHVLPQAEEQIIECLGELFTNSPSNPRPEHAERILPRERVRPRKGKRRRTGRT